MGRIIAAINTTLDGVYDHTAGLPDAGTHRHYTDLLDHADAILYGRTTYQLMQYWQTLLQNPSGEKAADDFARAIDRIPKIVFSRRLQDTGWDSARFATKPVEGLIGEWKQQPGKDILVGSRSLILQLLKQDLIDELQLCVHPVIAGSGALLFEQGMERAVFELTKTKPFRSGAIILYYQPKR